MSKLYGALSEIQARLKVPKLQYSSYGEYFYRNLDDILETLKPILRDVGAHITQTDTMLEIGGKRYVKATTTLHVEGESISCDGWAREREEGGKMSSEQYTGSASSYARKSSLCGMFLLDDERDSDAVADAQEDEQPKRRGKKPMGELEGKRKHFRRKVEQCVTSDFDIEALNEEISRFKPEADEIGMVPWLSSHYRKVRAMIEQEQEQNSAMRGMANEGK